MNNKKGTSVIVATVLVILVTTAIITIIWIIIIEILYSEPEFRITVEECHTEMGEYDGYKCSDDLIRMVSYAGKIENYTRTDGVFCSKDHDTWEREVCENVEVGLIIIISTSVNESSTFYTILHTSVKDLSIEWLDENCGLLKDFGNGEVITEGSDFLWNIKYKCGDYKVEVKR